MKSDAILRWRQDVYDATVSLQVTPCQKATYSQDDQDMHLVNAVDSRLNAVPATLAAKPRRLATIASTTPTAAEIRPWMDHEDDIPLASIKPRFVRQLQAGPIPPSLTPALGNLQKSPRRPLSASATAPHNSDVKLINLFPGVPVDTQSDTMSSDHSPEKAELRLDLIDNERIRLNHKGIESEHCNTDESDYGRIILEDMHDTVSLARTRPRVVL